AGVVARAPLATEPRPKRRGPREPQDAVAGGTQMNSSEQELRQALAEIARIAGGASRHQGLDRGDHHHRYEEPSAAGADIGCELRQLPERLQDKASKNTKTINPALGVNS